MLSVNRSTVRQTMSYIRARQAARTRHLSAFRRASYPPRDEAHHETYPGEKAPKPRAALGVGHLCRIGDSA